jgi:transitional endoplasmic reticulum ATPase
MDATLNAEVFRLLEECGGKLVADDDLVWSDDRTMSIPKSMTLRDAGRFIAKKIEEDESTTTFSRSYRFRPWDGAMATHRALKKVFGMVKLGGVGFSAPSMVTIPVGVNETEQVPWGSLEVPILPDVTFYLGADYDREYGQLFQLQASGPRRQRHAINGVFNLVQDELELLSIYRGKAFDGNEMPEFIDVNSVDRSKIVYADGTEEQLLANVWALMRHTDEHRRLGLPLKRAVLLEGPYGTGKTVGATITAQESVANGWTFVYCRPGKDDIQSCMATARLYQPAVVFVEDVDVISDPETTGVDGVAKLLDLFDGMSSKHTEIVVVMTTNHPEKIHKGMVRPGRLDAVIHIGELDAGGIRRMTEVLISPENLASDVNWNAITDSMVGFLPAYVKEAVDRAQRYNLSRNNGRLTVIGTDDLVRAADGLRPQLELMNGAKEEKTVTELSEAFGAVMGSAVGVAIDPLADNVEMVRSELSEVPSSIYQAMDGIAILDRDRDVVYRLDVDE